MTPQGRKKNGAAIFPGDVFLTSSGRQTSPFPKLKAEKHASLWLIENAVEEARARGDGFNERSFLSERPLKGGYMCVASKDSMLEYLFGIQPVVVPKILKTLI